MSHTKHLCDMQDSYFSEAMGNYSLDVKLCPICKGTGAIEISNDRLESVVGCKECDYTGRQKEIDNVVE